MPIVFPEPIYAKLVDEHRAITIPWRDWLHESFNSVYPVGSIYATVDPRNPAETIGIGTWVRFAQGKVLVGVSETEPEFATVMQSGGEKTHVLTVPETPCACP